MSFQLEDARSQFITEPYEHFFLDQIIADDLSQSLLKWLETSAPWNLVEASFYEQYEFSFWETELPQELSFIKSKTTLDYLCSTFEKVFNAKLDYNKVDVTAHKLINGQRIRIHNDFIPDEETHRLVIQINSGWVEENGGLLMLFSSSNADDISQVINPKNGCALGFAISPNSYHAVSRIYDGERYTLVYSFHAA